jgi:hypothetical protein
MTPAEGEKYESGGYPYGGGRGYVYGGGAPDKPLIEGGGY